MNEAKCRLYSGRLVDLLTPTPEVIDMGDIVHALSHLCRFNGHTSGFYSVAEHSVRVSRIVPARFALVALLHDATEAYLGDVVAPLKALLPHYVKLERKWWLAIAKRFNLPTEIPPEVKAADQEVCRAELRDLMGHPAESHLPRNLTPLDAWEARRAFRLRLRELSGHDRVADIRGSHANA